MRNIISIIVVISTFTVLFSTTKIIGQCVNESNIYSFEYDGKTYEIIKEKKTWVAAAACAVERGGYLIEINSETEQNAIYSEISNAGIDQSKTIASEGGGAPYLWLGGTDNATEGKWILDGNNDEIGSQFWQGYSNGNSVGGLYSNWGYGKDGNRHEPDNYHSVQYNIPHQNALAIALTQWPSGSGSLGQASQWNDIYENNTLYYIVEYDSTKGGSKVSVIPPLGSGTEQEPYIIETLDDLSWMAQTQSGWGTKYYIQTADIDASLTATWDDSDDNGDGNLYNDANDSTTEGNNEGWSPIGTETNFFLGYYDGGSYKIDGLTIKRDSTDYIGFFGNMRKDFGSVVTIKNLGLTNVNFVGNTYIGGFIGQNFGGTIANCYSTGSVESLSEGGDVYVAGFVGYNNTKGAIVEKCYSRVNVTSLGTGQYVGGFAGRNRTPYESGAVIRECYSTGNIRTNGNRIGGFVGQIAFAKISNCYSTSSVIDTSSTATQIGGFTGRSYSDTVEYCYFAGEFTGDNTKGFIGTNNNQNTYIENYLDTLVAGANQSAIDSAATEKSTVDMKLVTTFTNAGWDFDKVWEIVGDNYPTFKDKKVSVEKEELDFIPKNYSLEQNYPNPFNPTTVIEFNLPSSGNIELSVFDILGQKVITLVSQEMIRGSYKYTFNASNLPSGIYFYKLQSNKYNKVKKMLLLK